VITYVESNFILELAFRQEDHQSCESLLQLAEVGSIQLVLPAFCVASLMNGRYGATNSGGTFIAN
jgi:hypothetical protein